MKKFRGLYPALINPFRVDGRIDASAVQKLVAVNLEKGVNGFYVAGSTGESDMLSVEERKYLLEAGNFRTAYDVMNHWGANHGAISYGHIGADLITLCSMLRIPVCMHNVAENDIFRPASWNAYGMDPEGQDYRACRAYGPLYR